MCMFYENDYTLKKLQSILEDVRPFHEPQFQLEQYKTSAHLAAAMMFTIEGSFGDIEDRVVADLGCGTAMLAIAAEVMGARHTIGVDVDPSALAIARENVAEYEVDTEFIEGDIGDDGEAGRALLKQLQDKDIDTVVMNPPFGTRRKGIDMIFVHAALQIASTAVYSLHKTSTRRHILKQARKWGSEATVLAEMRFDLPRSYKFHRKKTADVEVDFIRFTVPPQPKPSPSTEQRPRDHAAAAPAEPSLLTSSRASPAPDDAVGAAGVAVGGAGAGAGAGAAGGRSSEAHESSSSKLSPRGVGDRA